MSDLLCLAGSERLRQVGDLFSKSVVLVAKIRELAAEFIVFTLQTLDRGQNIVELIQPLQDLRATVLLLFQHVLDTVQGFQNVADAALLNHIAGAVGHHENHAAVHHAALFGPVVHCRSALAVACRGHLIAGCAVLHQERLDRVSARQRQFVIVSSGAR